MLKHEQLISNLTLINFLYFKVFNLKKVVMKDVKPFFVINSIDCFLLGYNQESILKNRNLSNL